MSHDINVNFVIRKDCRNENECSEEMQLAFVACDQHKEGGLEPKWVHEEEITNYKDLTKKDVFVLNEFAGELFDKLRATKCLLVGPRCLSCCLTEGTSIPSGPEPVFTVALRGLTVSASGLSKIQKETIKRRVFWMGGQYTGDLTADTTHLIADTVLSDKYIKSVEKGIPVMRESWIEAVWQASLRQNINGSSQEFENHRLPPFFNLQITTSGIPKRERQNLVKLIDENGGTFSGAFQSEFTDVVVLTKEGVCSEKYKAALEFGKAAVSPNWVIDSAAKGIALPFHLYKVTGASTSSPVQEHKVPDMTLNFSRITNVRAPSNVDETRATDISTSSARSKSSQDARKSLDEDKELDEMFENFDMSLVKKAGPIFDGFCIWVCAVSGGSWRDKASAIVSRCGAIRFSASHERVTHALCPSTIKKHSHGHAPQLHPKWVIDSVLNKCALDEAKYLIDNNTVQTPKKQKPSIEPASPMSKRNLQLLRQESNTPAKETTLVQPAEVNDELVNHYLSQNIDPVQMKTPEGQRSRVSAQAEITDDMDDESQQEQIFKGITFEINGLDDEAVTEIEMLIKEAGGDVVVSKGAYTLVPLEVDKDYPITDTTVTVFWLKDCLSQVELVRIEYFHRPVGLSSWVDPPLRGVVASLSTYSGLERAFLDELAKLLGATTQLRFCRRSTSSALASTHLICPTPIGDKYLGALKWALPAVHKQWLLDCAHSGTRLRETPYLVGDTKAPSSPEPAVQEPKLNTSKSVNNENTMLPKDFHEIEDIHDRDTPLKKLQDEDNVNDMSPASRYIAMARQGLLGGDTQETPKRVNILKEDNRKEFEFRTPPLEDALSTPNLLKLSPTTRRRITAIKKGEMPSDPVKTPINLGDKGIPTPESGFGAALRPGSDKLSPESRKRLWKVVNDLPSKQQDSVRKQTPLSEIRNRFLAQFNGDVTTPPADHSIAPRKLHLQDQVETPPAKLPRFSVNQSPNNASTSKHTPEASSVDKSASIASIASLNAVSEVDEQLQRLNAALSSRISTPTFKQRKVNLVPVTESEPGPESQPNTVGWDDTTPSKATNTQRPFADKRFMLSSNVDNREELISMITDLGGEVSDSAELDVLATHLVCALPTRSEKMLGAIANGKWALHPTYVTQCHQAHAALDEEEFEWGNPRAVSLPSLGPNERSLSSAAHRWRYCRSSGLAGPFKGVKAIIHAPIARRRLLQRLVLAGDGYAPDLEPPYECEDINVCFADTKRCPLSERDAKWLKERKIPVCPPVLLSSYLTEDPQPNPKDHCLPEFRLTRKTTANIIKTLKTINNSKEPNYRFSPLERLTDFTRINKICMFTVGRDIRVEVPVTERTPIDERFTQKFK